VLFTLARWPGRPALRWRWFRPELDLIRRSACGISVRPHVDRLVGGVGPILVLGESSNRLAVRRRKAGRHGTSWVVSAGISNLGAAFGKEAMTMADKTWAMPAGPGSSQAGCVRPGARDVLHGKRLIPLAGRFCWFVPIQPMDASMPGAGACLGLLQPVVASTVVNHLALRGAGDTRVPVRSPGPACVSANPVVFFFLPICSTPNLDLGVLGHGWLQLDCWRWWPCFADWWCARALSSALS